MPPVCTINTSRRVSSWTMNCVYSQQSWKKINFLRYRRSILQNFKADGVYSCVALSVYSHFKIIQKIQALQTRSKLKQLTESLAQNCQWPTACSSLHMQAKKFCIFISAITTSLEMSDKRKMTHTLLTYTAMFLSMKIMKDLILCFLLPLIYFELSTDIKRWRA